MHIGLLLAAFPFVHSWMLLWSAAALAPIVIHLWNRQRYQVTRWAANHLLALAVRRSAKRIRLQDLILLVMRTSILLLFAIALAEPVLSWLPSLGDGESASGHTHRVIVIDASYSMQCETDGESRFAEAQHRAIDTVRNSQQGDGYSLLLLADPPQVVVGDPSFDSLDIIEEISKLRPTDGSGNLTATVSELKQVLAAAQERHPRLRDAQVTIISDMGKNTWETAQDPSSQQLFTNVNQFGGSRLVSVGTDSSANAWISGFRILQPVVSIGQPVNFELQVQHNGRAIRRQVTLEVTAGSDVIHRSILPLTRDWTAKTISFSHRFDRPGETQLTARLSSDSLKLDDSRWLCLRVRKSIRVLCVRGKPAVDRYLRHALAAQTARGPKVNIEVKDESAITNALLSQYDCLLLCNIGRFNQPEATRLTRYLNAGGGIVFFLGDQVQVTAYNRFLTDNEPRILPVRLTEFSRVGEYYFDPLEFRHPMLTPFAQTGRNVLSAIPSWRYIRCEKVTQSGQVALAFTSGDPAIVEEKIGRGRVVVFTSDVSLTSTITDPKTGERTPWSALPVYQGFPPLVRETLHLALAGQRQLRNVIVGQPIQGSVGTGETKAIMLSGPQLLNQPLTLQFENEEATWTYLPKSAGIFTTQYEQTGKQLFAVNVDTSAESALDRVSVDDLAGLFTRTDGEDADVPKLSGVADRPPVYRFCLGLVLALLCVESLVAWRFGTK